MKRLYVDMDGTLAVFKPVDTLETLYEEGYFRNLMPHHTVVEAVRNIIKEHPDIEVNVLSSVLADSKFALREKNAWLDQYLPEIDMQHRIFPPCGADKKDYIQGGVTPDDYLLDDYSENLHSWEPPAKGIKLLNGINATKGTWTSDRIRFDKTPEELVENIVNVMNDRKHYQDESPRQDEYVGKEEELVLSTFSETIVNAGNDISKQNSEWGAWWARIASDDNPMNYIDIDITGYNKNHEISAQVIVVHQNEVVNTKNLNMKINDGDFANSLHDIQAKISREYNPFLKEAVQKMGKGFSGPLTVYSPLSGNELTLHEEKLEKAVNEKLLKVSNEVDYTKLGYMPDTYKVAQTFFDKETQIKIAEDAKRFLENCSLHHLSEGAIREFGKKIIENNGVVSNSLIVDEMDAIKEVEIEMKKLERVIEKDILEAGFRPTLEVVTGIKQLNLIMQRTNTMADIARYAKLPKHELTAICAGKEAAVMMVHTVADKFRNQELEAQREQLTAKAPKIDLNLEEGMDI